MAVGSTAPRVARGGRSLYGAPLGILMLDARFPRIPDDMGNAATWPFPVLYHVVRGATPKAVALRGAADLLPAFIEAARDLVDLGAEALTTNCGFLSQAELAAAVAVPVATSALMQVPWVQATLPPGRRVGLLTVSGSTLTPAHLSAAGVPAECPRIGTEGGREFFRVILARGEAGPRRRRRRIGSRRGRPHPGGAPSRVRRHRAGMHEHAPLCRRPAGGVGAADFRHHHHVIGWFHAGLRPRSFE